MLLGIQKQKQKPIIIQYCNQKRKRKKELKIFNDKTEKTNFIGMILDKSNRFKI